MTQTDLNPRLEVVPARLRFRITPGASDLVFVLVLVSVLVGGRFRLLNDPGTFWHLRLGHQIAATGDVPRFDDLTFTHAGSPWVDQSWAFDLGLATVVGWGGLSLACLVTSLALAGLYAAVTGDLERDGRSPLVALVVGMLAAGVGATHFLVRPHVLTLVLVWVMLRICQRFHERGGWGIAWAPVVTALWANVHGGFLAGPIILVSALMGEAVTGPSIRERKGRLLALTVAIIVSLLAALATPYGLALYRHVVELLVSSRVTDLIQEYQPIPFGRGDVRVVEIMILGLIAVPMIAGARMTRYELIHTLVWLHLALGSIRHAPIFALAAAPGLSRMLQGLVSPSNENARLNDFTVRRESDTNSLWPGAAAIALVAASLSGVSFGSLDRQNWPLEALPVLRSIPAHRPLFHEQDWGGLVEWELAGERQAFIDDRFELFGRGEILAYVNALEGGPEWDEIQRRWHIEVVWIRPERAGTPSWKATLAGGSPSMTPSQSSSFDTAPRRKRLPLERAESARLRADIPGHGVNDP
ncbi:MAG: hypothetical protein U0794_08765 [Isosphaeraceae bacterium]